ncbi:MAG: ribose 5-phosphate isomerase B [Rickettsiaceae bacterium]|nr:ribose 5-phosphate isomerase B [Rickettsiaceae bacterium]
MIISIASDHAGFSHKAYIKNKLEKTGYVILDHGCNSIETCDYPDYAQKLCSSILEKQSDCGILICSTGIGMSICANRFSGIKAALCCNEFMARKAREHNNANVLVLGSSLYTRRKALIMTNVFLAAEFEGGRHLSRLAKIS